MTEDTTKSVKLTFKDGLPLGHRAMFKHEREWWIAIPLTRYAKIVTLVDRLCGVFARIVDDQIRMINDHPEDARRITEIIGHTNRARRLHRELIAEKVSVNK